MYRSTLTLLFAWALGAMASGCSFGSGSGFTLFPERNNLLDVAKQFRESTPVPVSAPTELQKQTLPNYLVEPSDVLAVIVPDPVDAENEQPLRIPYDQPVLPDGTIDLGKFGRIHVAGKTLEQIEADISTLIRASVKGIDYVDVRLTTRNSKVFYVLGEVNAPNAYPLSGRETVLDAILAAGGITERASQNNIILSRPTGVGACRTVLPVCYRQIVQLGDTTTNYQIAPGDRIFVPTRGFFEGFHKAEKTCNVCNTVPERSCVNEQKVAPAAALAPVSVSPPASFPGGFEIEKIPAPRQE